MAYKVFTNGSVLNASEINDNLMNQSVMVFSNSTARAAALTAPVEGMLTWLQDLNRYEYRDGSGAWVTLGSAPGLTLISSTPFTSATTLDIDNVFSTNYDSYQIMIDVTSTTVIDATIQLRVSGTTATSNYNSTKIVAFNSVSSNRNSSQASAEVLRTASAGSIAEITLNNPFLAQRTNGLSTSYDSEGYLISFGFNHTTATSYTGFRLNLNSTTGIVRVYGLGK